MKRISLYLLIGFFIIAGVNHFVNPDWYYPLIPDYLGYKVVLNFLSGVLEVALGLLLISKKYRNYAVYGLIALMILFIPAHIHFIRIGSCIEGGLCVPEWVGWVRLVVIHPLLILWIYRAKE